MQKKIKTLSNLLGLEQSFVSHREKFISALGGFIAIITIITISKYFLGPEHFWLLIPSMGASSVLLFATPHGQLSQPWPLVGGNLISAVIGVTCAVVFTDSSFAMAMAVGFSILTMYYLKCIHPPGGATALSAVLATESIHSLGYEFIITPVLLNVLSILLIAICFNYFFHWRKYPIFLSQKPKFEPTNQDAFFDHEDFINALKEIDSFVDINEYDLKRIFALANASATSKNLETIDIKEGCYYSNGIPGKKWSIRQVMIENTKTNTIVFRPVTRNNKTPNETSTKKEFSEWAKYEITEENGHWHKKS